MPKFTEVAGGYPGIKKPPPPTPRSQCLPGQPLSNQVCLISKPFLPLCFKVGAGRGIQCWREAGESPWGRTVVTGGDTGQEYRREGSRAVGLCSRREAGVGGRLMQPGG